MAEKISTFIFEIFIPRLSSLKIGYQNTKEGMANTQQQCENISLDFFWNQNSM